MILFRLRKYEGLGLFEILLDGLEQLIMEMEDQTVRRSRDLTMLI